MTLSSLTLLFDLRDSRNNSANSYSSNSPSCSTKALNPFFCLASSTVKEASFYKTSKTFLFLERHFNRLPSMVFERSSSVVRSIVYCFLKFSIAFSIFSSTSPKTVMRIISSSPSSTFTTAFEYFGWLNCFLIALIFACLLDSYFTPSL